MRYLGLLLIPILFFAALDSRAWAKRAKTESTPDQVEVRWDVDDLEVRLQGTWMIDYQRTLEQYPERNQRARRLAISEMIFGFSVKHDRSMERTIASVLGGSATERFHYEVARIEGESMVIHLVDAFDLPVETWHASFVDEQTLKLVPGEGATDKIPVASTVYLKRADAALLESAIRSATLWQYQ